MKKAIPTICLCILVGFLRSLPVHGSFESSYHYYIDLAQKSLKDLNYSDAFFYLESAHVADPDKEPPFDLLKQIRFYNYNKLTYAGYVLQAVEALERDNYRSALFYFKVALAMDPVKLELNDYINDIEGKMKNGQKIEKAAIEKVKVEQKEFIDIALEERKRIAEEAAERKRRRLAELAEREVRTGGDEDPDKTKRFDVRAKVEKEGDGKATSSKVGKAKTKQAAKAEALVIQDGAAVSESKAIKQDVVSETSVVRLDDALWARQPGTVIEIALGTTVIFEGRSIKRYLVVTDGFLDIELTDNNHLAVKANRVGQSIFHIWDDHGRWTFNLKVIIPSIKEAQQKRKVELFEEYVTPFKLAYSSDWSAFYVGDKPSDLTRRNLKFTQWFGVFGETPYGKFDASGNIEKFPEDSTVNTARAIGLTDGKIGPFKDFRIRGYDTAARFSSLTLPGRSFRGVLLDAYAFHRKIKYTYLRGQDRAVFRSSTDQGSLIRKSYIEGIKVKFFPDQPDWYAINYARGWGEERLRGIKDKLFSFETNQQYGRFETYAEVAHDEDKYAAHVNTTFSNDPHTVKVNIRDIEKGFTTVTSNPSDKGEVGGNIIYNYKADQYTSRSNLDIYRDRSLSNPDNPNAVNYNISTALNYLLDDRTQLSSAASYSDTPQLISPSQLLRFDNRLTKTFELLDDFLVTAYIGYFFQANRYDLVPSSEFNRHNLSSGVRVPLFPGLTYFANYSHTWVEVLETDEKNQPSVISTGLSYSKRITDDLSTRMSVTYTDEQNAGGTFSFLSGIDTLRGSVGVSYHPNPDLEIFMDGGMRKLWSEESVLANSVDADVRFGLRTSFDTFFRWDPLSTFTGYVFKDYNRNGLRDEGEEGIRDVMIKIGNQRAITDRNGRYIKKVRAKKIKMSVDLDTIPKGASFSTDTTAEIEIEHLKTITRDFGITTYTGLSGFVFVDENNNGIYDALDKPVSFAKIIVDSTVTLTTNASGRYNVFDIQPGLHTVRLDVNSLPMDLLPLVKLENEIDVLEGETGTFDIPLKRR